LQLWHAAALQIFFEKATIGSETERERHHALLDAAIASRYEEYSVNNANRDPFKNLEFYLLPLTIALAAFFLRSVTDMTCFEPATKNFDFEWGDMCQRGSQFLAHLYLAIFMVVILMLAATGHGAWARVRELLSVGKAMAGGGASKTKKE
jgi:hypothetical protein